MTTVNSLDARIRNLTTAITKHAMTARPFSVNPQDWSDRRQALIDQQIKAVSDRAKLVREGEQADLIRAVADHLAREVHSFNFIYGLSPEPVGDGDDLFSIDCCLQITLHEVDKGTPSDIHSRSYISVSATGYTYSFNDPINQMDATLEFYGAIASDWINLPDHGDLVDLLTDYLIAYAGTPLLDNESSTLETI